MYNDSKKYLLLINSCIREKVRNYSNKMNYVLGWLLTLTKIIAPIITIISKITIAIITSAYIVKLHNNYHHNHNHNDRIRLYTMIPKITNQSKQCTYVQY